MTFKKYLLEAGEAAGKMELVKTPVEKAREFAEKKMKENGRELDKEIPDFDSNYQKVQKTAEKYGKTKRKDMPVIEDYQVKQFQKRLKAGVIDVDKPFSEKTPQSNPFPEGLTGKEAEFFLQAGIKLHDGDKDDKVKTSMKKVKVKDLKPIQKQIYFDKSMSAIAEFGAKGTKDFLPTSPFIASSDLAIIDGHHRWLSGNLLDPEMTVTVLVIDMPIKDLLPLTKAYGDAIGNKRNQ
jgi:hypothetical protein